MADSNYKIPSHVAIILDGNGRWATKRGLKRSMGHKEGFETLKKISKYKKFNICLLNIYN